MILVSTPILQVDVREFLLLYAAVKKGEVAGLGGASLVRGLQAVGKGLASAMARAPAANALLRRA